MVGRDGELQRLSAALDTAAAPIWSIRQAALAASHARRNVPAFWKALYALPALTDPVPVEARSGALPDAHLTYTVVHRVAGLGSLGRPRYTALADWRGAPVAREAKALLPSAWSWANPESTSEPQPYRYLLERAMRSPDPTHRVEGPWVVRRLAPDNWRIEPTALPARRD